MFGDFIPYLNNVMDYSSAERKVIADNISNTNTPNYKSKTVDFSSYLNGGLELNTTDSRHINLSANSSDTSYVVESKSEGSSRVDGNNVNQTQEMINMLKNNSLFTTSVNALNKEYSMIKTAIGR